MTGYAQLKNSPELSIQEFDFFALPKVSPSFYGNHIWGNSLGICKFLKTPIIYPLNSEIGLAWPLCPGYSG